jgi:hypothetical protein
MYREVTKPAEPAPTEPAQPIAPAAGPMSISALRAELADVKSGYEAGRVSARGVESLVWDLMNRSIQLKDSGAISQEDYEAFRQERSAFLQRVRQEQMSTEFAYD